MWLGRSLTGFFTPGHKGGTVSVVLSVSVCPQWTMVAGICLAQIQELEASTQETKRKRRYKQGMVTSST
jgi:hypothetical protein